MISVIKLTDGWLTDWGQEGGRFKEWVRSMNLTAINHGWFYAIRMEPVHFCHNVMRVISWLPFLWDDRDFDNAYLWRTMRYKISRMREHISEHRIHEGWEQTVGEMEVAEYILTRLIEDKYCEKEWDEYHKKYPRWFDSLKESDEPGVRVAMSDCSEERHAEASRIFGLEENAKQYDSELIGQWLHRHWRGWWD